MVDRDLEQVLEKAERDRDIFMEEIRAERVVTLREAFDYGFKAGLGMAGLTSSSDTSYENWLLSRARR